MPSTVLSAPSPAAATMSSSRCWLSQCTAETMYMPPFERYIHLLPDHVLKKRLRRDERGYNGYLPDFSTLKMRDDNELLALRLVQEYTNVPVPQLVYEGEDFNVFTRIPGICVNRQEMWDAISPRQREGLILQTQSIIRTLATQIPAQDSVRSPHPKGLLFRPNQLDNVGPFPSTASFIEANPRLRGLIDPHSTPVFSHLDWDLSNIIIAPNGDYVVGVVDWERAAWFPEAGRAIHRMHFQWDGWDGLFDGMEIPGEGRRVCWG